MLLVHCFKFATSTDNLLKIRHKFQHKICFRPHLTFLRAKSTQTIAVTTRMMRDGKFLKLYRHCNRFYLLKMLPHVHTLPENCEYKTIFSLYKSFLDFNRVLDWKLNTINPLFNMKKLKTRKLLYYLPKNHRVVLILSWVKAFLKLNRKNFHNNNVDLFQPLHTFITTNKKQNAMTHLKLKIYSWRLMRG